MAEEVSNYENMTDLACEKIGGHVLFATDDWFAPAENLLKYEDPVFKVGLYTDYGKWMDGWETRRKRKPGHDWCIIELGMPGIIKGVEVDTAYFTGNYAPKFSLQAVQLKHDDEAKFPSRQIDAMGTECSDEALALVKSMKTENWQELIPMTPLTAGYINTSRKFFKINSDKVYSHIRLNIFPDGGIARLRIYGQVLHKVDFSIKEEIDLVAMKNGGVCHSYSNAHYGHPKNLICPGVGKNMGDGWETARRIDRPPILQADERNILQVPGNEWAIFRLGCIGKINKVHIDTNHFKGNYPDSAKLEGGLLKNGVIDWKIVLPTTKLSAHAIHEYHSEDMLHFGPFSHVRVTIMPDGGISRLRIFGQPIQEHPEI
ncbi:allantoicase [Holotrichia oblita]|uniref:Allantoicase n=1 Tax=Holotrichia oblita TaxID=644536 RepID=A0ACB9T1R8_HOLOL|nr:allantoicase [Holotrichia oblita]